MPSDRAVAGSLVRARSRPAPADREVQDRQHEQVQQGRGGQPPDDDGGHRPFDFATGLAAQIPNLGAPVAPPQKLPGDTVVATVKGVNVTIDDVRKMADTAPLQVLRYLQQDPQGFIRQMFFRHPITRYGVKNRKLDLIVAGNPDWSDLYDNLA